MNLTHIFREGNFCTDNLVKHGVHRNNSIVFLDGLPDWLMITFLGDLSFASFVRF